ncbi:hypothetical protein BO86DRAFT_384470 [Aspergillus japonicus CBS 114.51]|nr:hypothetical protein BO86DRAFT_384470 [Aspergillus japonicus CBS 114.51]RAH87308.1 hypothetical protein BO86DRAFT_384470 [Aspergillus japonicus CBS 114.51]
MADPGDDILDPMMDDDTKENNINKSPDDMGPQSSIGPESKSTAPDARAEYDAHHGMNRQLLDTSAGFPAQMCDAGPIDSLGDTTVRNFSSEDEINETLYGRDGSM